MTNSACDGCYIRQVLYLDRNPVVPVNAKAKLADVVRTPCPDCSVLQSQIVQPARGNRRNVRKADRLNRCEAGKVGAVAKLAAKALPPGPNGAVASQREAVSFAAANSRYASEATDLYWCIAICCGSVAEGPIVVGS